MVVIVSLLLVLVFFLSLAGVFVRGGVVGVVVDGDDVGRASGAVFVVVFLWCWCGV